MNIPSIGTPLSPNGTRLLLLGSGELGKEVALEAMRLGLEVIAVDRYANAPAMQVAHRSHVINMLDPDTIVLGGGVSNIERLYQEVHSRLGKYVFSDHVGTRIVKAQHGDSSGVRGAAWLWP